MVEEYHQQTITSRQTFDAFMWKGTQTNKILDEKLEESLISCYKNTMDQDPNVVFVKE